MNSIPHLKPAEDALPQLRAALGANLPSPLKLHLGCGEVRLPGYLNVDFPPLQHTVQISTVADVYADITQLRFQGEQISEIRLHHVFEHFDRPTAFALLAAWYQWLAPDGQLVIETPDFNGSVQLMLRPDLSLQQKQSVLRHLFGSHEASWAVHYDGWYEEKYRWVLSELGYQVTRVEHGEWQLTRNVTICARRGAVLTPNEIAHRAKKLLRSFMVDNAESEQRLWQQWCKQFDQVFARCFSYQSAPKVSIFIPTYNRERYLPQTLESLLTQTFNDFEIVIADDGSTDNTVAVARSYAARDSRIRVLVLPHRGEVATRNDAIAQTNPHSQYLLNHDSDDLSVANKLSCLVNYLDQNPGIAIVGCRAVYFNDQGQTLGVPEIELTPERIRESFGRVNSMINSASLIRREVFVRIGAYREEFRSVDDYDFFTRALMAGFEMANLAEPLHLIRLHPESVGSTRAALQQQLAQQIQMTYEASRRGSAYVSQSPRPTAR